MVNKRKSLLGIVRYFGDKEDDKSLYGEIYGEDNELYYVNEKEVLSKTLNRNDIVLFETTKTSPEEKGRFAAHDTILWNEDKNYFDEINSNLTKFDYFIDKLIALKDKICENPNILLTVKITNVTSNIDIKLKLKSKKYKDLLDGRSLLGLYITAYNLGLNRYLKYIQKQTVLLIESQTLSLKETNKLLFDLPVKCYDQDFVNKIVATRDKKDSLLLLNKLIKTYHDTMSADQNEVLDKSIYNLIKTSHMDIFDNEEEAWVYIQKYFSTKDELPLLSNNLKIKYWNNVYNTAEENLKQIYDNVDSIDDVELLPVPIYSDDLVSKIKVPIQRLRYIKKSLHFLKNRYDECRNNATYKEELINAILFIWENEGIDLSENLVNPFESGSIATKVSTRRVASEVLFVNDKKFARRVLHSNFGRIFNENNRLFTECYKSGLLNITSLDTEYQVKYFQQCLKEEKVEELVDKIKYVFYQLNEAAKIKALCVLAYNGNGFGALHWDDEDKQKIDKTSILYIVMEILKARAMTYTEKKIQLKKVMDLIYDRALLEESQKSDQKQDKTYFSLDPLLHHCYYIENKTNILSECMDGSIIRFEEDDTEQKTIKPFYCEGQYTAKKIAFCPTKGRRCLDYENEYRTGICPTVLYDTNFPPEQWGLSELLDWSGLLQENLVKEVLGNDAINRNISGKVAGFFNLCNSMLDSMYCNKCNKLMEPDYSYSKQEKTVVQLKDMMGSLYPYKQKKVYAAASVTVFSCKNTHEEGHDQNVYLNKCIAGCTQHVIDSRKENVQAVINFEKSSGLHLCLDCGSGMPGFLAGAICPKCGSYEMETRDGKRYFCAKCGHSITTKKSTSIFCPNCYNNQFGNTHARRIAMMKNNRGFYLKSEDGIHFQCQDCGFEFYKKIPQEPYDRYIHENVHQVIIPELFYVEENKAKVFIRKNTVSGYSDAWIDDDIDF